MEEPALTIAPFTIVRGLMESSAIAAWLLDPFISTDERVQRSFAFRQEGYSQQKKLFELRNDTAGRDFVNQTSQRLNQMAPDFGFPPITNKKREIIGYGVKWEGITKLVASVLDDEMAYRILSAMAHGHQWATMQMSFKMVDHPTDFGEKALEKYFHPAAFIYLGQLATHSIGTAYRYLWKSYGWVEGELDLVFEELHKSVFEING